MKKVGPYQLTSKIGEGAYGTVYEAVEVANNEMRAVKMIKRSSLNAKLQQNLENEIKILKQVVHENVIKLVDLQKTPNNYYLIFDYANGGDIDHFLDKAGRLNEKQARPLVAQMVKGLEELKNHNIIHRDLKLANILLHFPEFHNMKQEYVAERVFNEKTKKFKVNPIIKIADLGFARELAPGQVTRTTCGTPLNMSPEILNTKFYNHKADIWSLGTVVFEILTGFTPFTGRDKEDLKKNIEKGQYKLPKKLKLSVECLDFLNGCLQFNVEKRMDWDQVTNHPFLKQVEQPNTLKLSLNETGFYVKEESTMDSIMMNKNPHKFLNEHNAILLNCKDSIFFKQYYQHNLVEKMGPINQFTMIGNKSEEAEDEDLEFYATNEDIILSDHESDGVKMNAFEKPIEIDDEFKEIVLRERTDTLQMMEERLNELKKISKSSQEKKEETNKAFEEKKEDTKNIKESRNTEESKNTEGSKSTEDSKNTEGSEKMETNAENKPLEVYKEEPIIQAPVIENKSMENSFEKIQELIEKSTTDQKQEEQENKLYESPNVIDIAFELVDDEATELRESYNVFKIDEEITNGIKDNHF